MANNEVAIEKTAMALCKAFEKEIAFLAGLEWGR
jgi:hypothetical protein